MILQIFLIIGGAWAVFKSQSLILEILNPEAAQAERQSSALISGAVIGAVSGAATIAAGVATGGASVAAQGALMSAGGAIGSSILGGAKSEGGSGLKQDESQAYRG